MTAVVEARAIPVPSGRGGEIVICLAVIALFTFVPAVRTIDLLFVRPFFDDTARQWLLPSANHEALFWSVYKLPKIFLSGVGGAASVWLVWRAWRRRWRPIDTRWTAALCVAVLTPLIVGLLKKTTGVSCPAQEIVFGGPYDHVAIWDRLLGLAPYNTHLRCWPAGHASAGFGLLGLRLLAPPNGTQTLRFWMPGLGAGWVFGLYQMARGQHYLSHTVITMMLAVLLTSLALAIVDRQRQRG